MNRILPCINKLDENFCLNLGDSIEVYNKMEKPNSFVESIWKTLIDQGQIETLEIIKSLCKETSGPKFRPRRPSRKSKCGINSSYTKSK